MQTQKKEVEPRTNKIDQAIHILEGVALENSNGATTDLRENIEYAKGIAQDVSSIAKSNAKRVNKLAHKRPWAFVGAATVVGVATGYLVSRLK